jgi:hypothetical protein
MCVLDGNAYDAKVTEAGEERDEDLEACALLLNNKAQALLQTGPGAGVWWPEAIPRLLGEPAVAAGQGRWPGLLCAWRQLQACLLAPAGGVNFKLACWLLLATQCAFLLL